MSLKELSVGFVHLVHDVYAPKHYYQRLRTFLKEYHPAPLRGASLDWQHFLALVRSFLYLGVLGRERFYYWRLLIWTIFCHPRLFPVAVTHAIFGHHFFKVARKIV
jgi:hypothetical protein